MLVRAVAVAVLALMLAHLAPAASASAEWRARETAPLVTTHADAPIAAPLRKRPCGGAVGRFSYCIFAGFGGAGLEPDGTWLARRHNKAEHRAVRPLRDLFTHFDLTFRGLARAPPPRPVSTTT